MKFLPLYLVDYTKGINFRLSKFIIDGNKKLTDLENKLVLESCSSKIYEIKHPSRLVFQNSLYKYTNGIYEKYHVDDALEIARNNGCMDKYMIFSKEKRTAIGGIYVGPGLINDFYRKVE